jgi:acetyl-CoA carboxylase biotin carboxyl carrier protein
MVLESMKMEIPVEAPCTGTVVELLAAEGQAVEDGQLLARVE